MSVRRFSESFRRICSFLFASVLLVLEVTYYVFRLFEVGGDMGVVVGVMEVVVLVESV